MPYLVKAPPEAREKTTRFDVVGLATTTCAAVTATDEPPTRSAWR